MYGIIQGIIMKTCSTCKHWNFKTSTVKCWGQCLNKKVHKSTYVSVKVPDDVKNTDDLIHFKRRVDNFCEIYFEENTFGCLHHES